MRIFGVVGWKNAGKTGLMERLVTEITGRGFSVSTVKHAHHTFDVDHPGKDSHRHRIAGATEVLLASRNRWALMHELRDEQEPTLAELLTNLSPADLVLVEGYKRDDHPKVEAHRAETGNPLIAPSDASIKAIAADVPLQADRPVFDLNDTAAVADFILVQVGLSSANEEASRSAAQQHPQPPPLRNDCFALPPGVDWTPVDDALSLLKQRLHPITGIEALSLAEAEGRVLAAPVTALRANPPHANSAVDGYGFAGGVPDEAPVSLPLMEGRSAAGVPYEGEVPPEHAIRVLTGASLPVGVDTVVLDEDVVVGAGQVAFRGPLKRGANTRKAGEDVQESATLLPAGRRLTPADLAYLASGGVAEVPAFRRLRVAVISTGDELVEAGSPAASGQIFDANRPMLLAMVRRFGFEALDLGRMPDDRAAIAAAFDRGAAGADVILTSGGASAGDEDHVSALLRERGAMQEWRIALKPGRPLALGMWHETPVFGLPGNPVAALVCTLVFARPAMERLAGGNWLDPVGFDVPAAFEKRKKPGRREYLRARIRDGRAEVFPSEGSGRISSLSWAEGLVEIADGARHINPGDPVRFLPYGSFGL
ncbi:molybdopterin molybdotransferase [Poseidonocella pacifica]|uniref:Molybdopterin molybdenumtransferase n=1 Tax=Poseidonocella pacifica TaxID=871651 RepID=A0A1I0XIQ3_9RHOB|nr:bifunctional molybdopterin-guanine dinucleotide biosynthesis adaptor protein MobB/molybdopterin molybdotransferase MoeA [Poseidonocella pacifica]SFA99843.1 molybdopterin molybdotransferase [Poseidonocella pacifica]